MYGANHAFQHFVPDEDVQKILPLPLPIIQHARNQYEVNLRRIVGEHDITVILEEANEHLPSIAAGIGESRSLQYSNINMPREERLKAGLAPGLTEQEHASGLEHPHFLVREDYMYQRIVEHIGDDGTILVICGKLHVDGIGKRLQENDVTVRVWAG